MNNELTQRINNLKDEQALEAVNLLAGEVLGALPDEEVRDKVANGAALAPNETQEMLAAASGSEVAELCRATLSAAAIYDSPESVARALDGVGEKAVLLEIAVIGLLASGVFQQLLSRGRKREVHEITIIPQDDGRVAITAHEEIEYYSVGNSLTALVSKLAAAGGT